MFREAVEVTDAAHSCGNVPGGCLRTVGGYRRGISDRYKIGNVQLAYLYIQVVECFLEN